jgi:hypothetical protein
MIFCGLQRAKFSNKRRDVRPTFHEGRLYDTSSAIAWKSHESKQMGSRQAHPEPIKCRCR